MKLYISLFIVLLSFILFFKKKAYSQSKKLDNMYITSHMSKKTINGKLIYISKKKLEKKCFYLPYNDSNYLYNMRTTSRLDLIYNNTSQRLINHGYTKIKNVNIKYLDSYIIEIIC